MYFCIKSQRHKYSYLTNQELTKNSNSKAILAKVKIPFTSMLTIANAVTACSAYSVSIDGGTVTVTYALTSQESSLQG